MTTQTQPITPTSDAPEDLTPFDRLIADPEALEAWLRENQIPVVRFTVTRKNTHQEDQAS